MGKTMLKKDEYSRSDKELARLSHVSCHLIRFASAYQTINSRSKNKKQKIQ